MSAAEQQASRTPERRAGALTEDRVALMIQESIDERMTESERRLVEHIDQKFAEVRKMFTDHVEEAFPSGPLHKHKAYHEGRIRSAQATEQIKTDLIGWIIKGALGIVFFLLAVGALEWIKRELSK